MKPHSAATAYMAAMEFVDIFAASCDVTPLPEVANGKRPKASVLLKRAELLQWLEQFKGLLHYTEPFSAFITADNGLAQVPSTWSISIQDILQDEDTYKCTDLVDAVPSKTLFTLNVTYSSMQRSNSPRSWARSLARRPSS